MTVDQWDVFAMGVSVGCMLSYIVAMIAIMSDKKKKK